MKLGEMTLVLCFGVRAESGPCLWNHEAVSDNCRYLVWVLGDTVLLEEKMCKHFEVEETAAERHMVLGQEEHVAPRNGGGEGCGRLVWECFSPSKPPFEISLGTSCHFEWHYLKITHIYCCFFCLLIVSSCRASPYLGRRFRKLWSYFWSAIFPEMFCYLKLRGPAWHCSVNNEPTEPSNVKVLKAAACGVRAGSSS